MDSTQLSQQLHLIVDKVREYHLLYLNTTCLQLLWILQTGVMYGLPREAAFAVRAALDLPVNDGETIAVFELWVKEIARVLQGLAPEFARDILQPAEPQQDAEFEGLAAKLTSRRAKRSRSTPKKTTKSAVVPSHTKATLEYLREVKQGRVDKAKPKPKHARPYTPSSSPESKTSAPGEHGTKAVPVGSSTALPPTPPTTPPFTTPNPPTSAAPTTTPPASTPTPSAGPLPATPSHSQTSSPSSEELSPEERRLYDMEVLAEKKAQFFKEQLEFDPGSDVAIPVDDDVVYEETSAATNVPVQHLLPVTIQAVINEMAASTTTSPPRQVLSPVCVRELQRRQVGPKPKDASRRTKSVLTGRARIERQCRKYFGKGMADLELISPKADEAREHKTFNTPETSTPECDTTMEDAPAEDVEITPPPPAGAREPADVEMGQASMPANTTKPSTFTPFSSPTPVPSPGQKTAPKRKPCPRPANAARVTPISMSNIQSPPPPFPATKSTPPPSHSSQQPVPPPPNASGVRSFSGVAPQTSFVPPPPTMHPKPVGAQYAAGPSPLEATQTVGGAPISIDETKAKKSRGPITMADSPRPRVDLEKKLAEQQQASMSSNAFSPESLMTPKLRHEYLMKQVSDGIDYLSEARACNDVKLHSSKTASHLKDFRRLLEFELGRKPKGVQKPVLEGHFTPPVMGTPLKVYSMIQCTTAPSTYCDGPIQGWYTETKATTNEEEEEKQFFLGELCLMQRDPQDVQMWAHCVGTMLQEGCSPEYLLGKEKMQEVFQRVSSVPDLVRLDEIWHQRRLWPDQEPRQYEFFHKENLSFLNEEVKYEELMTRLRHADFNIVKQAIEHWFSAEGSEWSKPHTELPTLAKRAGWTDAKDMKFDRNGPISILKWAKEEHKDPNSSDTLRDNRRQMSEALDTYFKWAYPRCYAEAQRKPKVTLRFPKNVVDSVMQQ